MKSCNPRSWPEIRFAVGLLLITMCGAVVAIIARNIIFGIMIGAIILAIDFLLLRISGLLRWRDFHARLWFDDHGVESMLLVGSSVTLRGEIRCLEPSRTLMIAPLLPKHLNSTERVGRIARDAEGVLSFSWDVRAGAAGPLVVPGLFILRTSPLGLFRTITMTPARASIFAVKAPEVVETYFELLKRMTRAGDDHRRFVRGGGTDFRELRQYQPLDPLNRIDWKATARRNELIVRDMEEPREYTISVVLDGSCDLTHGLDGSGEWFERTLHFLGTLADVTTGAGMRLNIVVYDEGFLHTLRLTGIARIDRLLYELVQLPRLALERHAAALAGPLSPLEKRLRAWEISKRDTDAFLAQYLDLSANTRASRAMFTLLADTEPGAVLNTSRRCKSCWSRVFPDEPICLMCGLQTGDNNLPPRAAGAIAGIAEALQQSHGRQMFVFVSSLCGGELSNEIAETLIRSQAQHRSVHIVAPSAGQLRDAHTQWPGSLGHGPVRRDILRDMDRLRRTLDFAAFQRKVTSAGVQFHDLDDESQLSEMIHALTMRELHVA